MPITFDYSQFETWAKSLISGERQQQIVNEGIDLIYANVINQVPVGEGYMLNALAEQSKAQRTGDGWVAGIGDKSKVGSPTDKAPKNTIRQFKDWYWNNKKK